MYAYSHVQSSRPGEDRVTASNYVFTVPVCDCNVTGCQHWTQAFRFQASYSVAAFDGEPPPRPRPWVTRRAVVLRYKDTGLPPWRPRQQRARDGI